MTLRTRSCLLVGALLLPLAAAAQPSEPVEALVVRTVRDVERRAGAGGAWADAVRLDRLLSGYQVRTGPESLTVVEFADETKLVVRERSLLEIRGRVEAGRIASREVEVTEGNVAFSVTKRPEEDFRFTSPTGVASIRGTEGGFDYEPGTDASWCVITEGTARMTNAVSGEEVMVEAGRTAIARADGTIELRRSTPEDLRRASLEATGQTRRLVVPGSGEDGAETLIIEWEDQ